MRKFPISARHVACMYIGSADSSKFPLLILTPNCLLTYFVTHRQYFHLIVNKMYVFLGIIYAIYELFNLTQNIYNYVLYYIYHVFGNRYRIRIT